MCTCVKKPSFRRVRFPDEVVFDDSIREADGDFFILQYFLKYPISQDLCLAFFVLCLMVGEFLDFFGENINISLII